MPIQVKTPTHFELQYGALKCAAGWEESAAHALFTPGAPNISFNSTFAVHLFASHGNMVQSLKELNANDIKLVSTNFNMLVRDLV